MLLDEVQSGVGRTGTLWGYEQEGITHDAMSPYVDVTAGLSGRNSLSVPRTDFSVEFPLDLFLAVLAIWQ